MLDASVTISSKSRVLSVAWLNSPGVVILGGGSLVCGLLHPLRHVVISDLADWVRRLVQLCRGVPWWIVILGLGFNLGRLLGVVGVGLVVVLVRGPD